MLIEDLGTCLSRDFPFPLIFALFCFSLGSYIYLSESFFVITDYHWCFLLWRPLSLKREIMKSAVSSDAFREECMTNQKTLDWKNGSFRLFCGERLRFQKRTGSGIIPRSNRNCSVTWQSSFSQTSPILFFFVCPLFFPFLRSTGPWEGQLCNNHYPVRWLSVQTLIFLTAPITHSEFWNGDE